MFGLGVSEIAIILVVALVVLGPRRLPELAQQLGRGLREFRRAARDLQVGFDTATAEPQTPPAPTLVNAADDTVAMGVPAVKEPTDG